MAFWSALRRWAERAVAAGALTVDHIRNAPPEACTLLPGGNSPAPVHASRKPTSVASAESPGEAAELLDELLSVLLELPGDGWFDVMDMLPAKLVDRLCSRIEGSNPYLD